MSSCNRDSSPVGARDAALVALLYGAGLRRSEAVSIDLSDYNRETGELAIRGAKGREDRLAYATNGPAEALGDWIGVRGGHSGPLFCRVNKGGRIAIRRLTGQAVLPLTDNSPLARVCNSSPEYAHSCRFVRTRCGVWSGAIKSAMRIGPSRGICRRSGWAACFVLSVGNSRRTCRPVTSC